MWATSALAAVGVLAGIALAADFDWSAIEPSEQLEYHPCYDGFQCARLSVPLDWQDTNNTKRVAIAITTLRATVPADDPSFGGRIILNPGGPGGSGVAFVQKFGRRLQAMTEGKKHYEFLGFDPRGIAYTTPRADCFGGSHIFARDSLLLETRGIGGLDASESGLRRVLALDQAFGSLCETKDLDDDILAYVSTASVARDIIEITDRAEELRRTEKAVPQDSNQHPMSASNEGTPDKPARVLYWGFSYGTILGNTLASMFPGRMGRVVLDGVDDAYDYHEGKWLCNLLDTEKIVDYFYDTCFDGTDNCPLWKKGDKSGKDIKGRIDKLISDADINPISLVQSDGSSNLRVITGNDIRAVFVFGNARPLYAPLPYGFDYLANILAHALKGNYSLITQDLALPLLQDACSVDNSTEPGPGDAQAAILCGDADFADPDGPYHNGEKQGLEFWKSYVETLKNQSSTFGPSWSGIASACSGWRVRPKWRFAGPWGTPPADPSLKEGVPAAPILFTSSRLDPVTPLYDAYLMSNDHPGSAVLIHETVGHCAAATGWSECFNERIRAYFDDGIVPANGTVCDTTCKPFSKDGYCLPPAEFVAAGVEESFYGFAAPDRRSGGSFRPLGLI